MIETIMIGIIILLTWLLLAFYGIKFVKEGVTTALSHNNALALRGLSAIEIMLGHIGISTGSALLYPNRKAGILFVGVFFMLSGYGLMSNYQSKSNYLDGFLTNRFIRICAPAIPVIILSMILNKEASIRVLFLDARWYLGELLLFYLLFYLFARFCPEKIVFLTVISSITIILIAYYIQLDNPWYGSTLCFPLGIGYSLGKWKTPKNWKTIATIFLGIVVISIMGFFFFSNKFIANVLCRNIASVSFCIVVLVLLERVRIGNRVSRFLGIKSYEIYLIHPIIISAAVSIGVINDGLFTMLVISVTIIFSIVYQAIMERILRGIFAHE